MIENNVKIQEIYILFKLNYFLKTFCLKKLNFLLKKRTLKMLKLKYYFFDIIPKNLILKTH